MEVRMSRYCNFSEKRGVSSEQLFALLFSLFVMFILASCSTSDDNSPTVWMPIEISLPAEQFVSPHDFETTAGDGTRSNLSDTRADDMPGDPGTYEKFTFPKWLYVFAVVTQQDGTTKVRTTTQELTGTWEKKTITNSNYISNGDSIYTYSGSVGIEIDEDRKDIEVYVAVWDKKLKLSNTSNLTSKNDVLNITASFSDEDMKDNKLANLYSTPHNLYKTSSGAYTTTVTDEYYGTVEHVESQQPHIDNLILYHVAAKVDLKWNVATDKQSSVSVPYIGLTKLKNSGCYLFKPMGNVESGTTTLGGTLGVATTVGNKWLGRKSFYVIPYHTSITSTAFPVKLKLREADESTKTTEYTKDINDINAFSGDNVFTPWIRGNINVQGSY